MNTDTAPNRAKTRGLSLFPNHEDIVDRVAALRGLQGNTFSPAIQYIITDWAAMRGLTPPLPALADLTDDVLTAYPPHATGVNLLRDTPQRIAGEDDPPTL